MKGLNRVHVTLRVHDVLRNILCLFQRKPRLGTGGPKGWSFNTHSTDGFCPVWSCTMKLKVLCKAAMSAVSNGMFSVGVTIEASFYSFLIDIQQLSVRKFKSHVYWKSVRYVLNQKY